MGTEKVEKAEEKGKEDEQEYVKFKVSAKLAKLLGEQSVSNPTVALSEIVKNAYDADASKVEISFEKDDKNNLTIIITDNGSGMTFEDIDEKWMVVGTSDKEYNPFSEKRRRKVGEKGIGRFAVQRLGYYLELVSKPFGKDDLIKLKIDWNDYSDVEKRFTEIKNPIVHEKRNDVEDSGLKIIIKELRDKWTKNEIENLEKQLSTIVPPIWSEDFSIIIKAPHAGLQKTRVLSGLLKSAAYRMESSYNYDDGKIQITFFLSNNKHANQTIDVGKLKCGSLKFALYYYPLGISSKYKGLTQHVLKDSMLKKQLQNHHGIKIFRDSFRVKPYGDPGNDWLGLNLLRVNDPTRAFSNNTLVGIVEISRDRNSEIIDTTTREGLIKNQAYDDMNTVLHTSIRALSAQRITDFGEETDDIMESTGIKKIHKAASSLARQAKSPRQKAVIAKAEKEITQSAISLQSDAIDKMRMYYGLSSLGISVAAIAHEIGEPIGAILQRTKYALLKMHDRPLSFEESKANHERSLKDIIKINEFMSFAAVFTSSEERRKSSVNLVSIIETVLDAYESIFRDQFIDVDTSDIDPELPYIHGFKVDFESIMINLVTNAIEALREIDTDRKLKITCHGDRKGISFKFSDSGNGISRDNRKMIFEPFITTKEEGTGLGLPIISETLKNYNGNISVVDSELNDGASFLMFIPRGEKNE